MKHVKSYKLATQCKCMLTILLVAASFNVCSQADIPPGGAAVEDLNDDGAVNFGDMSVLSQRFGKRAGEEGYLRALDLNMDGVIDFSEFQQILAKLGTSAETGPTVFRGRVLDGIGNPLPGVSVHLGANGAMGDTVQTGPLGYYSFLLTNGYRGETVVTFDGTTAVDPTPDLLSGQYPTIPNKPVFINGGVDNVFRDVSLPERDLTGSVPLGPLNAVILNNSDGTTTAELTQDAVVMNAGVNLMVPQGCSATFPTGEDPVLSITRVDPALLPVPMPPGLSSSLFITYQPGETEIDCPTGVGLVTEFDNTDGYPIGMGDLVNGPFLSGVVNGNFIPLVACDVPAPGEKVVCGPIPLPFDFAWYHVDIRQPVCPLTTVTGTVRLNDINMTPVAGASVSMSGIGTVTTNAAGVFSFLNVAAGPNGPNCTINPFTLQASANKDLNLSGFIDGSEQSVSAPTLAVPGGVTNVGDIKLGTLGTVQGRVSKLSSIEPFLVISLPDTDMNIFSGGFTSNTQTDQAGNYIFNDVPVGPFEVASFFEGSVQLPDGGGPVFKEFFGFLEGSIDFEGQIRTVNFKHVSKGSVKVNVVEENGDPVENVQVSLFSSPVDLGQGYISPVDICEGQTDPDGMIVLGEAGVPCFGFDQEFGGTLGSSPFGGVPMGPCDIDVFFGNGTGVFRENHIGPEDGCFVNHHGEMIELTVELPSSPPPVVTFPITKELWSIARNDVLLRRIDPNNGQTISTVPITIAGDTVSGGNGLAFHPLTNQLWALLKLDSLPSQDRMLATVDPATGVATPVGIPGSGFAGLTFDAVGTLYGVTGDGSALIPESLFVLSQADATATPVGPFGNGDDGEAIAYNTNDGLIYHASGLSDPIFEKLDLGTGGITNIPISTPPLGNEATALVFCQELNIFFWADGFSEEDQSLFAVSPDGNAQLIGPLDHVSKGLATQFFFP